MIHYKSMEDVPSSLYCEDERAYHSEKNRILDKMEDRSNRIKRKFGSISCFIGEILKRKSRDKWLSPKEINDTIDHYAPMIYGGLHYTVKKYAMIDCCNCVGMIKGKPPLWPGDRGYGSLVRFAEDYDSGRRMKKYKNVPEVEIMNILYCNKRANLYKRIGINPTRRQLI